MLKICMYDSASNKFSSNTLACSAFYLSLGDYLSKQKNQINLLSMKK